MRAVVVSPQCQGQGIGRAVVEAAIELAHPRNIKRLYLLTETATDYFSRFGFERIDRQFVPESVRASEEFTVACPESAIVKRLELN